MKKLMLILMCSFVFVCGGCEEEEVKALTQAVNDLSATVDQLQPVSEEIAWTLAELGFISPEALQKIVKVSEEIDRVQPQVAVIAEALKETGYTDDGLQNLLAGLQAANIASAPFNPYAAPVSAALALLSAVLGIFARNKAKEANKNAAEAEKNRLKYQASKQGVEGALITETNEVKEKVYKSIGRARADLGVK